MLNSGVRVVSMIISVVVYSLFGLLGGLIGAAVFKKNLPPPPPPGTIDFRRRRRWFRRRQLHRRPAAAAAGRRSLRSGPTGFLTPTRNFVRSPRAMVDPSPG